MTSVEITEVYWPDGIHAHGNGVAIYPHEKRYIVRTRIPGGSHHGPRYYSYSSYDAALDRANRWLTVTLPNRSGA